MSCATNLRQLSTVCEESCTMTQFTPPEIWKRHAVLLGIHAGSTNMKISECLGINRRTVQRIRKELEESNGDYEGTAARKLPSNRSDKKRTPEFVGEIQTMIGNDPSKSIRSIARDMGVSEFLIRQVVHKDIPKLQSPWLYVGVQLSKKPVQHQI